MADAALLTELSEIESKLKAGMSGYTMPDGRSVQFDLDALRIRKQEILGEINRQDLKSRRNYAIPRRAST